MCRNCEKMGHFSRDCPEPKNWDKHKCSNCGEMGHGPKVSPLHVAKENQANINSGARFQLLRTVVISAVMPVAMVGEIQVMLLVPLVRLIPPGTLAPVEAGKDLFATSTWDDLF